MEQERKQHKAVSRQSNMDRLPSFLCVDLPSPRSSSMTSHHLHRCHPEGLIDSSMRVVPTARKNKKPASPRRIGATSTKRKQDGTAQRLSSSSSSSLAAVGGVTRHTAAFPSFNYQSRSVRAVLEPHTRLHPPASIITTPSSLPSSSSSSLHTHNKTYFNDRNIEPCLVQLCRLGKWDDVLHRCAIFSQDLTLVPLVANDRTRGSGMRTSSSVVEANTTPFKDDYNIDLYHETALGIVCSSRDLFRPGQREKLVKVLVDINPLQVGASQLLLGHTPLRDAILNPMCSTEALEIMFDACNNVIILPSIYDQKDMDGLTPLDHLVLATQLGTPAWAEERVELFITKRQICRTKSSSLSGPLFSKQDEGPSPLIRLLSMGNSYEVNMSKMMQRPTPTRGGRMATSQMSAVSENRDVPTSIASPLESLSTGMSGSSSSGSRSVCASATQDLPRLNRILDVVKCLLDDDQDLLYRPSKTTGCLPIHVALRNYGNFDPLIQLLLDRDPMGRAMKVRNEYGDLPLHVACSVGVPLTVLRHVLSLTVQASRSDSIKSSRGGDFHHLVWSTNNSGYTPVDLEWVRNIESGNTLHAARTFYPLEATGVRKHCSKQDEFYRKLLNESVSKSMANSTSAKPQIDNEANQEDASLARTREEEARATFGCLLDRISLIIQSAASGTIRDGDGSTSTELASLLDVCKLCSPYSPSLPLPLLKLYLWLRSDELTNTDSAGKSAIHHVLSKSRRLTNQVPQSVASDDWKSFVLCLLEKCPIEVASMRSHSGRLPLHYALDRHSRSIAITDGEMLVNLQMSRHQVIEKLVFAYPEAVDQRDPVSGLYPYMMASTDPNLPLDTIFCLLRHSPSLCTFSLT